MAQLAIKGHAKRGEEVIEILKMLGGVNQYEIPTAKEDLLYAIRSHDKFIIGVYPTDTFVVFSLEEFLEKFPYKVGDKVKNARINECIGRITNVRWDDNEKQVNYVVEWDDAIKRMLPYFARDLQPYKEKTMEEIQIDIPSGYEFTRVDEDNQRVIFTKKQPQYPKTYKECCEVLGCKADDFFTDFSYNGCDVEISEYEDKVDDLLQNFRKLRYCRDAYWKTAGEQMGLGKPWEPNWNHINRKFYCIYNSKNNIVKNVIYSENKILAFSTEEMRDTFYENFKDLIEDCKNLI